VLKIEDSILRLSLILKLGMRWI